MAIAGLECLAESLEQGRMHPRPRVLTPSGGNDDER